MTIVTIVRIELIARIITTVSIEKCGQVVTPSLLPAVFAGVAMPINSWFVGFAD